MLSIIMFIFIGIIIGAIGMHQRKKGNPAKGEELIFLGITMIVVSILIYFITIFL